MPPPVPRLPCRRCASSGTTTLTISHNSDLRQYHTHELQLDGCGGSALKPLHGESEEGGSDESGEVVVGDK